MSTSTSPIPPPSIQPLVTEISSLLRARNQRVCVYESEADGLIIPSLYSHPDMKHFFGGGLAPRAQGSGVARGRLREEDVPKPRAPTPALVRRTAKYVRGRLGATYCLCESGTAGLGPGPGRGGGAGYVALAVAGEEGVVTREVQTGLGPDREANKVQFAVEALGLLREVLLGEVKLL